MDGQTASQLLWQFLLRPWVTESCHPTTLYIYLIVVWWQKVETCNKSKLYNIVQKYKSVYDHRWIRMGDEEKKEPWNEKYPTANHHPTHQSEEELSCGFEFVCNWNGWSILYPAPQDSMATTNPMPWWWKNDEECKTDVRADTLCQRKGRAGGCRQLCFAD